MSVCMNCSQHDASNIEVVFFLSKKISWYQYFQLARAAQELLMSVCMNCSQHDASNIEVVFV